MSQQFRRIPLDEFLRQASNILDGIATRGETVLLEHNGRFFTLSAYSASRKHTPAKPQPPNMQDSLWSLTRSSSPEPGMNGADPTKVAAKPVELDAHQASSRRVSESSDEPSR